MKNQQQERREVALLRATCAFGAPFDSRRASHGENTTPSTAIAPMTTTAKPSRPLASRSTSASSFPSISVTNVGTNTIESAPAGEQLEQHVRHGVRGFERVAEVRRAEDRRDHEDADEPHDAGDDGDAAHAHRGAGDGLRLGCRCRFGHERFGNERSVRVVTQADAVHDWCGGSGAAAPEP